MTINLNIRNAEHYNKALDRLQEAMDACKRLNDEYAAISINAETNLNQVFLAYNKEVIELAHAWDKLDRAEKAAYKAAETFYGRSIFAGNLYSDLETRTLCAEMPGFDVRGLTAKQFSDI